MIENASRQLQSRDSVSEYSPIANQQAARWIESALQVIQWTRDLPAHCFGELGVNFRRAHIRVAQQFLN